jgi:hypothetical protein
MPISAATTQRALMEPSLIRLTPLRLVYIFGVTPRRPGSLNTRRPSRFQASVPTTARRPLDEFHVTIHSHDAGHGVLDQSPSWIVGG